MISRIKKAVLICNYHLSSRSRRMKLDLFWRMISPSPGSLVLNLGATVPHLNRTLAGMEESGLFEQPEQDPRWSSLRVIGANIRCQDVADYQLVYSNLGYLAIVLDGCRLPFPDQSIDVVFCNAVIEHLEPDRQWKMAEEIQRVGRSWFVTTPNFWYPVELHNKLPFVHFLPKRGRLFLQRMLGTWPAQKPLNLLSARGLAALFPTSVIRTLRATFYPETLIAVGRRGVSYRRGEVWDNFGKSQPSLARS